MKTYTQTLLKSVLLFSMLELTLNAQDYTLTLNNAINIALQNNKQLKISQHDIEIAHTRYEQAMSGNYPSIDLKASATRRDEAVGFSFQGNVALPADASSALSYSGALLKDAITVSNGGVASAATGVAVAAQAGLLPEQNLPFNMDVTVMGRDTMIGQLSVLYPLYTGGKVSSLIKQASLGKQIYKVAQRQVQSSVIFDIKKYYYSALLLRELKIILQNTKERLQFLSDLSNRMYNGGSLNVKKTDYLRAKLSVDLVKSMLEDSILKEKLALSALTYAMGLSYKDNVVLSQKNFTTPYFKNDLAPLIKEVINFNPKINTLHLALKIDDAKIDTVKSEYLPNVALLGNVEAVYNDYEYGLVNDKNKRSWTIGVGLKWNLFNGMLTNTKLEQSKIEKLKKIDQEILLTEGLSLQMKHIFLKLKNSINQHAILTKAIETATENVNLNIRAYQEDMVETKDVIEAQIYESVTKSNVLRALYTHSISRASADFLVGKAIENQ